MPLTLIASYAIFSFFLFYQQLPLKNFQGASEAFGAFLGIFAFVGMLFGLGFLLYWGYKVSWLQAAGLFGIAFAIKVVWFPIEAKLGLRNAYWAFSLGGFIALPVSGYFMWVGTAMMHLPSNKALQTDKVKLSCLLHSQKPRQLAFAAELGR